MADYEKIAEYLINDLGEAIEYCKCGHSDIEHYASHNTQFKDLIEADIKFHCVKCECVNFR